MTRIQHELDERYRLDQSLPMGEALVQTLLFLRRRWLSIMLCGLIGLAVSVLLVSRIEPLYKSTALLMIERPRKSLLDAERATGLLEQTSYIDSQLFVFYAADILDDVRRSAGLVDDPEFLPSPPGLIDQLARRVGRGATPLTANQINVTAIRKLRNAVSVSREGESNVVSVSVSAASAQKSTTIANAFVDAYIAKSQLHQADKAARIADWMENRALQIKLQLSAAELAVAAFRTENRLVEGENGATPSNQQLFELNAELIRTRTELAARRAAYNRATLLADTGGDLQTLPEVQGNEIVRELRSEMFGLERRIGDLIQQSNETDRRVSPLRDQFTEVNAQISAEVSRIIAAIGNEIETLEASEVLLSTGVSDAGGQSGDDDRANVTLQKLERVAESYRELYQPYLADISLAREGGSLLVSGTDVVSPAVPPVDPSYPPKKAMVVLFTLLGRGFGGLLGLMREWLQQGFVTAAQVESMLGFSVPNSLPKLRRNDLPMDIVQKDPASLYAEAVQVVRNALLVNNEGVSSPVIFVTSAGVGDGKTSLSSALAASAVNARQRVLIIDADFRRAGMSHLVSAVEVDGLSDILTSPDLHFDVPTDMQSIGIDIMPIGQMRVRPAALLNGNGMSRILAHARKSYDLIIIDGPPVANFADATILSSLSDTVVFVVRCRPPRANLRARHCAAYPPKSSPVPSSMASIPIPSHITVRLIIGTSLTCWPRLPPRMWNRICIGLLP
jgi:succinoglycan biosynthesis transport protein ExoP